MKKNISKIHAKENIEKFFSDIKSKAPKDIRKIKGLAMNKKIPLREKRKMFCQKCYSHKLKTIGIKNKVKRVLCENCRRIYRWKLN